MLKIVLLNVKDFVIDIYYHFRRNAKMKKTAKGVHEL